MTADTEGQKGTVQAKELVHPVYLDSHMLFNFLGRLEGGIALVAQRTESEKSSIEDELAKRTKFGAALSGMLNLIPLKASVDAEIEGTSTKGSSRDREVSSARTYTEAALFNLLLDYLAPVTLIRSLDDLRRATTGEFVQIYGPVLPNPLQQLVEFYSRIAPFLRAPEPSAWQRFLDRWYGPPKEEPVTQVVRRQIQEALRGKDPNELDTLGVIRKELEECKIVDLLMVPGRRYEGDRVIEVRPREPVRAAQTPDPVRSIPPPNPAVATGWSTRLMASAPRDPIRTVPPLTSDSAIEEEDVDAEDWEVSEKEVEEFETSPLPPEFRVVLTLSRDFLTKQTEEYLVGGQFTVIGKVTDVLQTPEDQINLARRATVGILGRVASEELLEAYTIDELRMQNIKSTVTGPALQVLPLAIFV